ncbi:MAG: hypothetical protein ABJC36_10090 [Gemmatimonadales bacterium]
MTGSVVGTQLRVTFPAGPGVAPLTHILDAGVTLPTTDEPECPL